jgi:3-hydroxybutyryl-CoA dehydrogenase
MTIVVRASDDQWAALTASAGDIKWIKANAGFSFTNYTDADAFFILDNQFNYNYTETTKPVFINCVTATLQELNTPFNVLRINGWNTFLQRPVWEIAGTINDDSKAVAEKLNKKIQSVKDEPGFISARIIAMIINEAYFALGDNVSTAAEIDTAMKLGTNYPYGPFEWAEKIGLNNIYLLLQKLSLSDKRYQPSPTLIATAQNN